MSLTILGLGTAVPPHRVSQEQAAALARRVICRTPQQAKILSVLFERAGVNNRYTVLPHDIALQWTPGGDPDAELASGVSRGPTTAERMRYFEQHAPPLARQAGQRAIEDAGIEPRQITHLVTASCTGFTAPGVDVDLIERLGLRRTTQRIHVGYMGCHGAINALRCALALTTADPQAVVLVCAVELCSLHYRFDWDPPRMVANALFGDGAAALIGAGEAHSGADRWTVAASGSCLLPDSQQAMEWQIGDYGFEMALAASVPELIRQHLPGWLSSWLEEHGHALATIPSWAIHPGGPRILSTCVEAIGLARDQVAASEEVLAEYGNMSSPTVLFIIGRLRTRHAPRPCVALAFGPGLTAEALLLR